MTKKSAIKLGLSIIGVTFLILFFSSTGYIYYSLHKIERVPIPRTDEGLGIKPYVTAQVDPSIRNIVLFGIDTGRNSSDPPHSDSIIIVTIDRLHNKIKLSSILRDSYVNVEGHGKKKITEAYTYGGPALAVKTLNQNFDLDIKNYVTVDFWGLSKIVDTVGGVSIDIQKKEITEINKWIYELSTLQHVAPTPIKKTGLQQLNGIQAVAYSRIRKVGDGDFERTARQRVVLNQLLTKVKNGGIGKFNSLLASMSPYVKTNISTSDMISTGTSLLLYPLENVEQQRFPLDGYCKGKNISGIWYLSLEPNIYTTAKHMSDYIFKDIKPLPKDPLF